MNEFLDYIEIGKKVELILRTANGAIRFYCTFEGVEGNSILVSNPKNKHVKFNCQNGQLLDLYAYTRGGVFKLKCRLLDYSEKFCTLSLPMSVDKIQRREYIRVKMKISTIIKLFPATSKNTIHAESRNISAKGINLLLDTDISKFSKIDLTLLFAEQTIYTNAKIIKIKPVKIGPNTYYDTSLEFISISDKEINFIVKKCFEFEAAQRKKMLDNKI